MAKCNQLTPVPFERLKVLLDKVTKTKTILKLFQNHGLVIQKLE